MIDLALNNATNVAQYYKEIGEKVERSRWLLSDRASICCEMTPRPSRRGSRRMSLSNPAISFAACGNTRENMSKAENKDIPLIPEAKVVKSGVMRVMELEEQGWTYVKP